MSAVLSTAPAAAASPIWYSKMERVLAELMANQEPAHTLLTKVEAWAKAGKYKADELHYSGLTDWLKLQEGKVTKQQVIDYLSAHGVQVTETVLGSPITELPEGWTVERDKYGNWQVRNDKGSPVTTPQRSREGAISVMPQAKVPTKFSQYVLPGGENYRELLLTLPAKTQLSSITFPDIKRTDDFLADLDDGEFGHLEFRVPVASAGNVIEFSAPIPSSVLPLVTQNGGVVTKGRNDAGKSFASPHFLQPNILAHIRFDERTDADRKRVLFIQELQSDWAQKGKRDGFQGPVLTAKQEARYLALKNKLLSERSDDELTELNDLQEKVDALVKTGPPSAPFVTKTEAWVSLAIKRLIRYAAEKDFDRVAFTTGAQQADRYDLSHQVSQIRYRESDGILQTWKHDIDPEGYQEPTIEQVVQADKLADFIGKEAAARIVDADPDSDGWKSLKGQALKVGGAGMTIFYDVLLPNITNDVLRRLGGGKVEMVNLYHKVGDYGAKNVKTGKVVEGLILSKEDAAKADPAIYETFLLNRAPVDMTPDAKEFLVQPTFDITPALRAKALEGLPLFFRGEKSAASTDLREATAAIDNIKAKWQNAPKINVWASIEDAPAVLAARIKKEVGRTVKGAWFGGEIHLFPENIGSIPELLRVVVHEGRHAGLEGVFGERLSEALKNLYEKNHALRLDVDRRRQATQLDIVTQVNEVLADMPLTAAKKLSGWKRVTGAMKSWLEDKGFKPLADWIVGPTGDELVKDVLYQADEWIRSGKRPATFTNDVLFHRAFHGTPHDFDRFDIGNIGIGEGAQAFGHGLYFAGKREVADGYRIALTSGGAKKQFEVAAALAASKWFTSGMKVGSKKYYDRMELQGDIADQRLSSMDMPDDVRKVFADKLSEPNGYLYEVELAPKESDYLDHDEPVYEYSDVATKVNRLFREKFGYKDGNYFQGTSSSGGEFYASVGKAVATEMGLLEQYGTQLTKNEAKIASEFLKEAGIPGIRYLDGDSRGRRPVSAGQGDSGRWYVQDSMGDKTWYDTEKQARDVFVDDEAMPRHHNYVIFDDKDVSITAKFCSTPRTDAPAFKEWFGDSKVVNRDGSPMVVYHGTANSFKSFVRRSYSEREGFYFTSDPNYARDFAESSADGIAYDAGEEAQGASIMPVYLLVRNPVDVRNGWPADVAEKLDDVINYEWLTTLPPSDFWLAMDGSVGSNIKSRLEHLGYDGLIASEVGATVYVTFAPDQIKSAVGNNGNFDASTPNILFCSEVGALPKKQQPGRRVTVDELSNFEKGEIVTAISAGRSPSATKAFKEIIGGISDQAIKDNIFGLTDPLTVHRIEISPTTIDSEGRGISPEEVQRQATLMTEAPAILVRRQGDGWRIVEGGHRLAAAQTRGDTTIKAIDVTALLDMDWQAYLNDETNDSTPLKSALANAGSFDPTPPLSEDNALEESEAFAP